MSADPIESPNETKRANPYVGPQTFERAQKELFFGREAEANELVSRVVARRLVLFYAESGAGKSSLINARLIPKLEEERNFEVLPIARVSGESPGVAVDNIYVYNLMNCLCHERLNAEQCAHLSLSDFLLNLVQVDGNYLYQHEETPDESEGGESTEDDTASDEIWPRVLIIDQFEELFITHPEAWEKRRDFFLQLNQAMQDDPFLYVVLSMREDHIAKLSSYARLLPGELRSRYRMQRMRKEAAIAAITGPAEKRGIRFTPQAVNDLVGNLLQVQSMVGEEIQIHEGPFVEPVQLQVVCYRLWDLLVDDADGDITQQELHAIVNNDLSEFVTKALADFYEIALAYVLSKVEGRVTERQIRDWFSNELITPMSTRNLVFEGDERTGSLPNQVVYLLASRFLVRAESRASGKWYELVHDRFVNPILRANETWREEQIRHDPLALAAREWEANGEDEELLYRDRILKRALNSVDWSALDPRVQRFLNASRDAQSERDKQEALRTVESERQISQRERRISRRLRLQRAVMVFALLVAIVAAAFAAYWGNEHAKQSGINAHQVETIRIQNDEITAQYDQITAQNREIQQSLEAMRASNRNLKVANLRSSALSLSKAATSSVYEPAARLLLAYSALTRALEPGPISDRSLALNARNTLFQTLLSAGPLSLVPPTDSAGAVGLDYSPDGRTLAAGYENGSVLLWDTATLSARRTLRGHSNSVLGVAFDPTGHYLATGSRDGTVILWNVETGEEIRNFRGHGASGVVAVAFHPDGDRLASAGFDGVAKLWDLSSGDEVASFEGHGDALQSVVFTPDGNTLLTASRDRTAIVWTLADGAERFRLEEHTDVVTHLAVTQDGRLWATASDDGSAIVWDAETGKSIRRFCCHDGWIDGIAFSPDGALLATASQDDIVGLWQVETGVQLQRYTDHTDHVWEVQFSPDGRYLASASWDDRVFLYPLSGNELVANFPYTGTVQTLAVSGDRQSFAIREDDQLIQVWRGQPGSTEKIVEITEPVTAMALDHTGEKIALLTGTGHVEVWVPGEKEPIRVEQTIIASEQMTMARLQFLPGDQGLVLIAPAAETQIQVIGDPTRTAVYTGALTAIHERGTLTLTHLVLAQNGKALATVNVSGTVSLWNERAAPRTVAQIQGGISPLSPTIKFSADGRYLAIKPSASALWIWDTRRAVVSTRFEPAQSTLVDFDFNRSGRLLAVALVDSVGNSVIHLLDLMMPEVTPLAIPLDREVKLVMMGANSILALTEMIGDDLIPAPTELELTRIRLLPNQELLTMPCTRAGRNLTYAEWQSVERDLGDINQSRICDNKPLHLSVLHAYLLSMVDGGKGLPLDLEAAQVSSEDLPRSYLQLTREQLAGNNFSAAHQLLQQVSQSVEAPSVQIRGELAQSYQQLCADGDWTIQETACAEATLWVTAINDVMLNHDLCQAGVRANRLNDVYAACERAVDLATSGDNLFHNLSLCPSSQIDGLEIYDAACAHAITLAEDTENLSTLTDACAQSVAGNYVALLLPICKRAVQLGVALDDEDADHANRQLCHLSTFPNVPDIFAESCNRVATVTPSLQNSSTMTGSVQSEEGDYWRFTATTERVTIEMWEQSTDPLDTYLTLYDSHLRYLTHNDDWQGSTAASRIQSFAITPTQQYYVRAHGYGGNTGDYALTLTLERVAEIEFDNPVTSSVAETTIWQFQARAGEVIDIHLTADDLVQTASFDLVTASGERLSPEPQLLESGDLVARQVLLPYEGSYELSPRLLGANAAYTLTLTRAAVPSWRWDETTVVSSTETSLWRLESDLLRWAQIRLDRTDETYNPYLELLLPDGSILADNEDGGGDLNALIDGFLLQADTSYLLRIRRPGSPATYQLTVAADAIATVTVGETIDLSTQEARGWLLSVETAGVISVTANLTSADGFLELRHPDGSVIASATGLPATLQERLSPTERPYLIVLQTADAAGIGSLSVNQNHFPNLEPGVTQHSSTQANPWWQFEAEAGDRATILLAGASSSYDPFLTLYDSAFSSLTTNDDNDEGWSGYDAEIQEFVIRETGVYYVEVGRPDNTAPYELTLTVQQ